MNLLRLIPICPLLLVTTSFAQTTRMVDGKFEVRGMVVSATDHKSIANADVEWIERRYQPRSLVFTGVDVNGKTKSDEQGRFALTTLPAPNEGAHMFVRASASGYAYNMIMYRNLSGEDRRFGPDASDGNDGLVLPLSKEATLAGTVVDDNDQPLADAEVYDTLTDPVRTDANGHFELTKRPEIGAGGRHPFRQFFVRHPDFVEREVTQTAKDVAAGDAMRIKLERGVLVSGKVVDAQSGDPVFGAGVTLKSSDRRSGRGWYAYTSADGAYRIRVPSGKYGLSCFYYGDKSDLNSQTFVSHESDRAIDATKAEEFPSQDLTMDRAATVHGHLNGVRSTDDVMLFAMLRPAVARGEEISPNELASPIFDDGSFHIFPVPTGKYDLILARRTAMSREPEPLVTQPLDVATPTQINGVEITLKELPPDPNAPLVVSGRALMPDGSPAAGGSVTASPKDPQRGEPRENVKIGSDGRFKLRTILPGRTYLVRVWDATEENTAIESIELAAGETWSKDITLKKGSTLKGVVRNANGEPMAGAEVMLAERVASGRSTTYSSVKLANTNDKGEYQIRGFLYSEDGPTLTLRLAPSGLMREGGPVIMQSVHDDLKVAAGETLDGLDFVITDGRRVSVEAVKREKKE